jgi:hypothetical protein
MIESGALFRPIYPLYYASRESAWVGTRNEATIKPAYSDENNNLCSYSQRRFLRFFMFARRVTLGDLFFDRHQD